MDYRDIETDTAHCGGQPVVLGARICVATMLACFRQGMGVGETVQQYASLKPDDVHGALAYNHLDEIECGLAADEEATVKAHLSARGSGRCALLDCSWMKMSTVLSHRLCFALGSMPYLHRRQTIKD
jgi:uncharacterized protein (DUF433 family)